MCIVQKFGVVRLVSKMNKDFAFKWWSALDEGEYSGRREIKCVDFPSEMKLTLPPDKTPGFFVWVSCKIFRNICCNIYLWLKKRNIPVLNFKIFVFNFLGLIDWFHSRTPKSQRKWNLVRYRCSRKKDIFDGCINVYSHFSFLICDKNQMDDEDWLHVHVPPISVQIKYCIINTNAVIAKTLFIALS